ncbi:UDP-N-acetylglucosamine 2-epimerase (non-hydrolyzing) [Leptolyngbya sp. 15MV]|nr:UDP-N-acetylglucosamine 2-epimerase (non-hydrolyzing) [Leptolyngbya sp. 15MV]
MSAVFFDELGLRAPDHQLGIHSLAHGAMTGRMLEALEGVMLAEKPAMVLVYGDTNSTLAGALAAAKLHIPVAHVEAGIRSFNRRMPEELNRVMTDHLSALLFAPTHTAVRQLAAEGIARGVHMVGDITYDATLMVAEKARARAGILAEHGLASRGFSLVTVHRAENTDDSPRFARILGWLEARAAETPLVWPVHPRTRKLLDARGWAPERILLLPPLGFLDMAALLQHAAAVFADSGGLQKEAYFHRIPCVTLREDTEWPETIATGWNRLWSGPEHTGPRGEIADFGRGDTAERIAAVLRETLSAARSS